MKRKRAMEKLEEISKLGGMPRDIVFLALSGISLLLSLLHVQPFPFHIAWIAIVLCGLPILLNAVIGMVSAFDIRADVLVSLALIASLCIGEFFAASEVAFIMQLGGLLEELTVSRARAGIERLVKLTPQTARVIGEDGTEQVIPAEQVEVGARLRVLPGEAIPVDGEIIAGQTSINQAVMTGESLPVDKGPGDEVSSGTVNQFGAFDMRATRVGEDSSIQRMIRLVQSADAGRAKIVNLADRWATWIVVIALSAAAITWIATGQIIRSVTILVVFCPCSLVLATPTAIMAAIGNATRHGFLVREGDALERLAKVKRVTFDKTGTLTYGTPEVVHVEGDVYRLCASVEQRSEHPLGRAIVRCWQATEGGELPPCEDFVMTPGRGITGTVNGSRVTAGREELLAEHGISVHSAQEWIDRGCTVTYVAIDGHYAGYIALSDTIRAESADMIAELKALGVQPVLLTGDHENAAGNIAGALGITEICSDCLPEDKLKQIDSYQKNDLAVCMIGDGVNDAPALKKADVGIAMGGVGSDIAVDASDIALVDDQIRELPHLLALSRRMMTTIRINLTFSMTLNVVAIVLAITGILNPVVGALVHNCGSVLVIINSALLLIWRRRKNLESKLPTN